jgi:hypothetical protein
MALCLAESLTEKQRFDAEDQMDRYCSWYERGLTSTKPESFVIRASGSMCRAFETIFSEMQIDELDQLPGRKRLSE